MKKLLAIVIIIIVVIAGYSLLSKEAEAPIETSETTPVLEETATQEEVVKEVFSDEFDQSVTLTDVTEGSDVRGINTDGNAAGEVKTRFNEVYELRAVFSNLPEPQNDDFYEGWIVRQGDELDVVSTGALASINGELVNVYENDTDLSDHLFYVLTLEPNDGDPAPADHILEGTLSN